MIRDSQRNSIGGKISRCGGKTDSGGGGKTIAERRGSETMRQHWGVIEIDRGGINRSG